MTFILSHVAILGVSGGGPTAIDELDFLTAIPDWWFVSRGYQQILFIDPAGKLPWYESIGQTADPVRVMVRILLVLLFAAICFMVWPAARPDRSGNREPRCPPSRRHAEPTRLLAATGADHKVRSATKERSLSLLQRVNCGRHPL
ncbi:MAG: hypothetical protein WCL44_05745 [bacterium]